MRRFCSLCLLAALSVAGPALGSAPFVYVSPVPGAHMVSPDDNIILRATGTMALSFVESLDLTVVGSASGVHGGTLRLANDGRTLTYRPQPAFQPGERVVVTASSPGHAPYTFDFRVAATRPMPAGILCDETGSSGRHSILADRGLAVSTLPGALPPGYPGIYVVANAPEPGVVIISPRAPNGGPEGNLVILDNAGQPIFYRRRPFNATDFQLQHGFFTYYDALLGGYYVLDGDCAVVDSFKMANGYTTDFHDFVLMPNGHGLLMAYDPQPVRMDSIVPGGNPNATVIGLVIQELDVDKNVVFQWRSWDHFQITDEASCMVNLTAASIDYVHANSMEVDTDGNLLISSRHMNEITKIDRTTGDIIWRLGPHAIQNQFTILGDPRGFSHQHDARRTHDGKLSLYDNGNCMDTLYSRGLEYSIDEVNKVATFSWTYRDNPDVYGAGTGNVQRRPSGGTMIDWGFAAKVTDLHADGTDAFEVTFDPGFRTYRGYRREWTHARFTVGASTLNFGEGSIGTTHSLPLTIHNPAAQDLEIDAVVFTDSFGFAMVEPAPFVVPALDSATVHIEFRPNRLGEHPATLYVRSANEVELFAKPVELTGIGTGSVDVEPASGSRFGLTAVGPSPGRGRTHIAFSLPEAEQIRLDVLDVQGRVVAELADETVPEGRHERIWTTRRPGLYFVRLAWAGRSSVRRVVVIP